MSDLRIPSGLVFERQPNFTHEDLTDDNADFLELYMMNLDNIEYHHGFANKISWSFRAGHDILLGCVRKLYDERYHNALDHGITTVEAVAAAVEVQTTSVDQFRVHRQLLQVAHMDEGQLQHYTDEALEELDDSSPRTTEVIKASASRFHGPLSTYALIGAAVSRKLERSVHQDA